MTSKPSYVSPVLGITLEGEHVVVKSKDFDYLNSEIARLEQCRREGWLHAQKVEAEYRKRMGHGFGQAPRQQSVIVSWLLVSATRRRELDGEDSHAAGQLDAAATEIIRLQEEDRIWEKHSLVEIVNENERLRHAFKNFHRLLCERFGYGHDDIDWERDQLSLIEWIAKRSSHETTERKPDGYLYRLPSLWGGTFLSTNREGAAGDAIETIPYFLGTPEKAIERHAPDCEILRDADLDEPIVCSCGLAAKTNEPMSEDPAGAQRQAQFDSAIGSPKPPMAMLPNAHHPGPGCSCRDCLNKYPAAAHHDRVREVMECNDPGNARALYGPPADAKACICEQWQTQHSSSCPQFPRTER